MAYKALEKMRIINNNKYGIDGPVTPVSFDKVRVYRKSSDNAAAGKPAPTMEDISQMEKLALEFIREDCENLRFDPQYDACEDSKGRSLKPEQIPYNMEKDLDRLCLENAIHRFMESGRSKEAFDIYFCFFEMFLGGYGKTKKVIEMLSEFETNASSLLMKHRDHYSHSAYVFIMGLAFYRSSPSFRKAYKESCRQVVKASGEKLSTSGEDGQAAANFLKYWGLTSLLHDIGYPFELTFEQVKSYFGNTIEYVPFVMFNMNRFANSKSYDILKRCDAVLNEIGKAYTKMMLNPAESSEKDKKQRKKIVKYLKGIVSSLYGKEDNSKIPCGRFEFSPKEVNGDWIKENIVNDSFTLDKCYLNSVEFIDEFKKLLKDRMADDVKRIQKLLPEYKGQNVDNLNEYLAAALCKTLGNDYESFDIFQQFNRNSENKNNTGYQNYLYDVLNKKSNPEYCGGFIDHAYFSAIILLECLFGVIDIKDLNEMYTNAITAILMHNSLYKFSITNYNDNNNEDGGSEPKGFNVGKHFTMERHPLAFLLMLCDEIQCWDRTSYGKNSRGELHPYDCELTFGENSISAKYIFDTAQIELIKKGDDTFEESGTYKKLREENGKTEFLSDIEHIVCINGDNSFGSAGEITLSVSRDEKPDERYRGSYLSSSNYIHFYKFAVLLHRMNHLDPVNPEDEDESERKFNELSLEYKINHISRAKKFARYLNEIDCFYSDKPVDMELIVKFTNNELQEKMGPLEHERWCWEHYIMGWRYGEAYGSDSDLRERTKTHKDMPPEMVGEQYKYSMETSLKHFSELSKEQQEKDTRSMNNLLRVLLQVDGIKIYKIK